MRTKRLGDWAVAAVIGFLFLWNGVGGTAGAGDLQDVRERGVLRHLGIPYAHFVRLEDGTLDGLDVEVMQRFAQYLGVAYQWVPTTWSEALGDLTGKIVQPDDNEIRVMGATPVKGDILANGLTILPWREKVVTFSIPTFPTGVWLVARADSTIAPIAPSGDFNQDIRRVRGLLKGHTILAMEGTCLDPSLYQLDETGVEIRLYTKSENLGELAPAVMDGEADATLLDIPDALIALQKWPGKIKVIGPVSPAQEMGVAVAPSSTALMREFNRFFQTLWQDGTYHQLVEKYYPAIFLYLAPFFEGDPGA